ncbi:MAG: D-aminoacylase [Planctomycetota bacterium]|nr:D-aminoacylase [Planctomycetota bacterium]
MSARRSRRQVLSAAAWAPAAWALGSCAATRRIERFDLVVTGGTLVDGTGAVPRIADVAVREGRIAAIGQVDPEQAALRIDARGLAVAPGFVDIHSHSDRSILDVPTADSRVLQGYTCEITGNCGGSVAPSIPGAKRPFAGVADYLKALEESRPAIHQALLVGHGTLRERRVGEVDRRLTASELATLELDVEQALADGAVGLSSGLEYVPGIYAPAEELRALAKITARRGRLYASHMRSEDRYLLEAVDEILELARTSRSRVQVSHLKACGTRNWPKIDVALARIEAAATGGFDVRADMYPYTAYSTGLTILLEKWARDGGDEAMLARLADPAQRARIRAELIDHVDNEPGGFDRIVIASQLEGSNGAFTGLSIAEIGARTAREPVDAFLALLESERGSVSYVGHAMQESDVAKVLAHPLVCVGSDGYVQAAHGDTTSKPHPRSFGTTARVLGRYCRELGAFDLATAVKKLAAMPAERAGLVERGRALAGFHADLVVFDPVRVSDRATFAEPRLPPVGIEWVIVAGRVVVRGGEITGERPGSVLRAG